MVKTSVQTSAAPAAIGPYSQAIRATVKELLYTSGQIGLDPATGALVSGGVEAEAKQVMANLAAVLSAGGASFESVLKSTIFLVDMNDFSLVNTVYASHFPGTPPARSTVAVAALPKGARVEIEVVAAVG